MFGKILIANRGEIACRIARTCRELGIATVAVYSEADAGALHVALCDEAWPVGPPAARESYLSIERIVAAARASGAQAIHPGYGFLSENADFALACAAAGIVFIGPPPDAIRAMGSKRAAKALMVEAGVPVVPGYHGEEQTAELLAREAGRIGYPVLLKASAGGGGKGMRRVDAPHEFAAALAAAKREASAAFGDEQMLIEKYVLQPRHVEVQVFADSLGNVVHLFERDCSVQRRHQKVIEEAPAPGLSEAQRAEMGAAAVAAARAIGYVGAGTVEFILEPTGKFYFMEMNTRLQVEHPVTEMITGQDLVAWQLAVAAGQALPLKQQALTLRGHAFEARIYAEDPDRDFLPATGVLRQLRTPAPGAHVRIDTGVREGDAVSVYYDPMLAKLIVWDEDRARALARLRQALAGFIVAGATTNTGFLSRIAAHAAFAAGGVDTGFIERYRDELLPPPRPAGDATLAAASLYELLSVEQRSAEAARRSAEPGSPWHSTSGWQLNSDHHHELHFLDGEQDVVVLAHYRAQGFVLELPGGTRAAHGQLHEDGRLRMALDGVHMDAHVLQDEARLTVVLGGAGHVLRIHDPLAAGMDEQIREGSLTAPMPGTVTAVLVRPGQRVVEGEPLMVLEAMKMEHTILAFAEGVVETVNFAAGDQVREGEPLLALARAE